MNAKVSFTEERYVLAMSASSHKDDLWREGTYRKERGGGVVKGVQSSSFVRFAIFVVLFFLVGSLSEQVKKVKRAARNDIATENAVSSEVIFLDNWARHVNNHPVQARDMRGFAEMGLRTQIYAHLLKDTTLREFDYFEKVLWPFLPGIKSLRQSFLNGTQHASNGQKGIVMSAGDGQFRFVLHFLSVLRTHWHSTLPVEIYYYGADDLSVERRTYLERKYIGVRTIDLESLGLFDAEQVRLHKQGFAIKTFSIIATNFTQVMLADADSVLLTHPIDFFQEPGYLDTGTLFFHDRDHVRKGPDDIIHKFMADQLAMRGPSERLAKSNFWTKRGIFEQESGIVVVDKSRIEVFAGLLLTAWQNIGDVREQTTYRVFWGDKETFWLAFELAQFPYYFVPNYAGAIGHEHAHYAAEDKGFCSEHPLHMLGATEGSNSTRTGKPAWFNGSLLLAKALERETFMTPTSWAVDGHWVFYEKEELWCMQSYTRRDMREHKLDRTMANLLLAADQAEKEALQETGFAP